MRISGDLVQWNDERGFGFVRDNDGKRYFVHISSIRRAETRPQAGGRVTFDPAIGDDGRPVAKAVVLLGVAPVARTAPARPSRRHWAPPLPGTIIRLVVAAAIVLAALATTQLRLVPTWVPIAYLVLGIVSMGLYWYDKDAAENGRWRTRENSLHFADLVGGVAGGLVAQALLRHKVRKSGFAATTWLIALLHLGGLGSLALGLWELPAVLW